MVSPDEKAQISISLNFRLTSLLLTFSIAKSKLETFL